MQRSLKVFKRKLVRYFVGERHQNTLIWIHMYLVSIYKYIMNEHMTLSLEVECCRWPSNIGSLVTFSNMCGYILQTECQTIFLLKTFKNHFALLVDCIWLSKNTGITGVRPFCTFWCMDFALQSSITWGISCFRHRHLALFLKINIKYKSDACFGFSKTFGIWI